MKKLFLALLFFQFPFWGLYSSVDNLEYQVFQNPVLKSSVALIHCYWDALEYRYQLIANGQSDSSVELNPQYLVKIKEYRERVDKIVKSLVSPEFLSSKDFKLFSKFYKALPFEVKLALDPIVKGLLGGYSFILKGIFLINIIKSFLRKWKI